MLMTFRPMMAAGALIAFGALGFALVLQYAFEMEPCPMCIFQRVAMVGVGVAGSMPRREGEREIGEYR